MTLASRTDRRGEAARTRAAAAADLAAAETRLRRFAANVRRVVPAGENPARDARLSVADDVDRVLDEIVVLRTVNAMRRGQERRS